MTTRVALMVNGSPIRLDKFVAGFIENTVTGMVASLKGSDGVNRISLDITGDAVTLSLDGNDLPANAFVNRIIRSTVYGMVSPLKGVEGNIESLVLSIEK